MSPEKSTIVRVMPQLVAPTRAASPRGAGRLARRRPRPSAGAQATRAAAALLPRLEHRSPAVAGRLAEWLWFRTPPTAPAAHRAAETPPGGEPFELPWGGGALRGRVYGSWGDPTAYLVHGWGGWWQQLGPHVTSLQRAGLCVVAFDAPAHGGSGRGRHGRRSTDVVEMSDALAAVVREFGRPTIVVAHSLGALAAVRALELGVRPEAYAFLAPALEAAPLERRFAAALALGPRSAAELTRRGERRTGIALDEVDAVSIASRQPSLPALLLVHDRGDREVPMKGSVELSSAWHDARLMLTDGLGHRRLLRDPAVVERVKAHAVTAAATVRRSSR